MTARKWGSNYDANGLKLTNLGAPTPASTGAARIIDVETSYAAAISRANHTGSQLANTISDFDAAVRQNHVHDLAAPTGPFSMAGYKITNLGAPAAGTNDAARIVDVETALAGVASGQTLKGTVRSIVPANVNIASPGSALPPFEVTPANGDIFLLTGQSTGSQNGPYVYNGAAVPMTRATNWDVAGEAVVGSYWVVREGTQADKFALLNNDAFTLGTTTAAFTYIGVAATGTPPSDTLIGNGALTSFSITHGFNTRAVLVSVFRNSSPWDSVDVFWRMPDDNTVVIEPDLVFTTNEFRVIISKA